MVRATNIGVLGSGLVGETLANAFLDAGYNVMRGSRDPSKYLKWLEDHSRQPGKGASAKAGTFGEAAAFGDVVVLAVKGEAAISALELAGTEALKGKIVIDTTNPIAGEGVPPQHGVLPYFSSINHSLMEDLQAKFAEARFVKAFSSVGHNLMYKPRLEGGLRPTMFICGNDTQAKEVVTLILDEFEWDVEDCGSAEAARAIEPLAILWCIPGFAKNEWTHAFKVLRAEKP